MDIEELLNKILEKVDVRQTVSKLREAMKDPELKEKIVAFVNTHKESFTELFKEEDAKARKNLALFLGETGIESFAKEIYETYIKEKTLFARSAYLEAIKNFDYKEYLGFFKEKASELARNAHAGDVKKHVTEELKALNELIIGAQGGSRHIFNGYTTPSEIMLLTGRAEREVLIADLEKELGVKKEDVKVFGTGVQLMVNDLRALEKVRTWREAAFLIPGVKTCFFDAEEIADRIAGSKILEFLDERLTRVKNEEEQGNEADTEGFDSLNSYTYRVELKSKLSSEKKAMFVRKLSAELDLKSEGRLINSPGRYEIEIRCIENRNGNCNILLKIMGFEDNRFAYRKEYEASSIKPERAAVIAALSEKYMKEGGRVLDPFCGVGTCLIERYKRVKADTSYGVDIYGSAVDKARRNTEAAGQVIHYINRDIFTFTHEYLFDEIITDMPYKQIATPKETEKFYAKFFEKAGELLTENGTIIMYTRNRAAALYAAGDFKLIGEFLISAKEEGCLLVFRRLKQ